MKRTALFFCVILSILAITLLPHATHATRAYPENLWTRGGPFGEPSNTQAMLDWNRTEYGFPWAWLVHDACVTEPSWYARIEPRYLLLYTTVAFFGGVVSMVLFGLPKKTAAR